MSQALSALLQKVIDIIDALKGPIFVCLTILGFLYTHHINFFGISDLLNRYSDLPPILALIWLGAGVLWLFSSVKWLCKIIKNSREQRTHLKQAQEKLYQLTKEQKYVVNCLMQPNQSHHYFERTELMEDLVCENIVQPTGTPEPGYNGRFIPSWARYFYHLQPWVRDYLEKHPEALQ